MKESLHASVSLPANVPHGGFSVNPLQTMKDDSAGVNPFLLLKRSAVFQPKQNPMQLLAASGNYNLPGNNASDIIQREEDDDDGRAENVQDWLQKRTELQSQHEANQRIVYDVINGDFDFLNQAQVEGTGFSSEKILHNTKEFIRDKVVVSAMTPTLSQKLKPPIEMARFWPAVPKEALQGKLFFDNNVAYPTIGSNKRAAEGLSTTDEGVVVRTSRETAHAEGMTVRVFMDRPFEPAVLEQVLVHEIQHIADRHEGSFREDVINDINKQAGDVGNTYRTEFRAYWLGDKEGGFGSPVIAAQNNREVAEKWWFYKLRSQVTAFGNQRQENIFWHMVNATAYPWVKTNYLQNPDFRNLVNELVAPQGGNLINSTRIEALRFAISESSPVNFTQDVEDIFAAADNLDYLDFSFLRSTGADPFWHFFDHAFAGPFPNEELQNRVALIKGRLEEAMRRR